MAVKTDIERAYDALVAKQAPYTMLWRYYDGDHPLVFSHERLREVFGDVRANFSQNWCAVVVDSVLDRVHLRQLNVASDDALTQRLDDLMAATELEQDADDAHKASLVCGEAFVIAQRDDDGVIEAYYNDPRMCVVFYDDDNPRVKSFAAKWWVGRDGKRYMTLYYADHFEHYVSAGSSQDVHSATAFVPLLEAGAEWPENETGIIPVFHFRQDRRRVKSVMANVIGPQAAFNKLFSDQMVAAEFGAFRQRWVISNADIDELKNRPNGIWDLPAGDGTGQQTQVGEFGETNLGNYSDAMERIAQNIARITRLPRHYFDAGGGDPSGEALIAMEAPLNKQVQRFTDNARVTWRKLGAYLLLLDGTEVKPADIDPVFDQPETIQPRTVAEIRQINASAGLPLRTTLRYEGKTPQEIEQVEQERADEQTASANLATAYLNAAQRNTSQQGATAQPTTTDIAPENMESAEGLNGAQIKSVLEVLDGVVTGRTPASVAIELLVSVGLGRERAALMVDDTKRRASKIAVEKAA